MTRDEKLELARALTRRLLAEHGEQAIVAVGVHGALARGDDGDLQLAVVTADASVAVAERALRHRGVVVDVAAIPAAAYLDEAAVIGPAWPLAGDQYVHHLPLHDPTGFFHKLAHVHTTTVQETPAETFAAAAGYDLVQAISWVAKARTAQARGDPADAAAAVMQAALFAALALGLATRTSYLDPADALRSAAGLDAAPTGFREPYRTATAPGSDPATAVDAISAAVDALVAMARRDGIAVEADDLEAFL